MNNKKIHRKKKTGNLSIKQRKNLDKYYTKKEIASFCYLELKKFKPILGMILEPSAGNGIFCSVIEEPFIALDIKPENKNILRRDFLKTNLKKLLPSSRSDVSVLGNPPFGYKGDLAIRFINKSLEYSDTVGFILPIQFRKWLVQKNIITDARLVLDYTLPDNSFLLADSDYRIKSCFQIWTTTLDGIDLRIREKPDTSHPDFIIYQYNRTKESEKYFDDDWDFAVPRQGFVDYNFKAFTKKDCDRKQQWIFIKANNKEILEKLLSINYEELSQKNSIIPGFGKADLILEYKKKFEG